MAAKEKPSEYRFIGGPINHRVVELFYENGSLPQSKYRIDHTLRFISTHFRRDGVSNDFEDSFSKMLLGSIFEQDEVIRNRNKIRKKTVETAVGMHKGERRIATNDPYLKHVLYTAYIAHEIALGKGHNDERQFLMMSGALFHDAIELKRKKKPNYSDKEFDRELQEIKGMDSQTRRKIMIMSTIFTPPVKKSSIAVQEWYEVKRKEWSRMMNMSESQIMRVNDELNSKLGKKVRLTRIEAAELAEIVQDIKIADVIANIVETNDDFQSKRVGHYGRNGLKSIFARMAVFNQRALDISGRYQGETFESKMVKSLRDLNQLVRNP